MNGEGFAYFRWHCLTWSWVAECLDPYDFCIGSWRNMQRQLS